MASLGLGMGMVLGARLSPSSPPAGRPVRLQPSLASLLLRAGAVRPRVGERRAGPESAVAGWEAWGACRSPSHGVEWGHIRPPRGTSKEDAASRTAC